MAIAWKGEMVEDVFSESYEEGESARWGILDPMSLSASLHRMRENECTYSIACLNLGDRPSMMVAKTFIPNPCIHFGIFHRIIFNVASANAALLSGGTMYRFSYASLHILISSIHSTPFFHPCSWPGSKLNGTLKASSQYFHNVPNAQISTSLNCLHSYFFTHIIGSRAKRESVYNMSSSLIPLLFLSPLHRSCK